MPALDLSILLFPRCPQSPRDVSTQGSENQLYQIPSQPALPTDFTFVQSFLETELATPVLDDLYSRLWSVARSSGHSIEALHVQAIKNRKTVPCEDPNLHLITRCDTVYIKPLPAFLLDAEFWTRYLSPPASAPSDASYAATSAAASQKHVQARSNRARAVGLLRSYAFLIQHPIDLELAHASHILPYSISWHDWSLFSAPLRSLPSRSAEIAPRYHYGQLRASRLDWAVFLFRPRSARTKWWYVVPYWNIGIYVQKYATPLVATALTLEVALQAIEVLIALPESVQWDKLPSMFGVFRVFSMCMVFSRR